MTDPELIERITRSLAFMLRHQPETFDLELDSFGYSDLEDVVQALNERLGEPVEEEDVRTAVSSGDRQRYEILGDRIRALYGHSIPIEPGPSSKPPEFLYVAVPQAELDRARRFGLRGGRRRFLHLATTAADAADAGRRAARDYSVLVVRALDAWEEGISFFDRISLWLAEEIPTHLLEVQESFHDGTDPLPRHGDGPREQGERDRDRDRSRGEGRGRGRRGRGRGRGRGGEFERSDRGRDGHGVRPERAPDSEPVRQEPAFASERGSDAGRERSFEREAPRREERPFGGRPPDSRPERHRAERGPAGDHRGEPRRDEPRRDEARRDEPRRDEPRRDEPRRDEPRRDEPRRDEPRRDEPRRDEPRRDERGRDDRSRGRDPRDDRRNERGPGPAFVPRERQEPSRREAPAQSPRSGGGFGAGLDPGESRSREIPSTPPPAPPSPPPARREAPAVDENRPAFGAGL